MAKAKLWFRVHVSIIRSRKVQTLKPELFKWLINLWAVSADNGGCLPSVSDIAWQFHCNKSTVNKILDQLREVGLIEEFNGTHRPHDWDQWQFESDVSTDRVKRFREKKRNVSETEYGNVSETPPEQSRAETYTETETEQSRGAPPKPEIPQDAETRIRKLADGCPNPQDFESGINAAIQEILSSANPAVTLRTMEQNLPAWWEAMSAGRVRVKPMRFVIVDRDYLRAPPGQPQKAGDSMRDRIAKRPNPRLINAG